MGHIVSYHLFKPEYPPQSRHCRLSCVYIQIITIYTAKNDVAMVRDRPELFHKVVPWNQRHEMKKRRSGSGKKRNSIGSAGIRLLLG